MLTNAYNVIDREERIMAQKGDTTGRLDKMIKNALAIGYCKQIEVRRMELNLKFTEHHRKRRKEMVAESVDSLQDIMRKHFVTVKSKPNMITLMNVRKSVQERQERINQGLTSKMQMGLKRMMYDVKKTLNERLVR